MPSPTAPHGEPSSQGPASGSAPVAVPADTARLERIYAEHELDLAPRSTGWMSYLSYLIARFSGWVAAKIASALSSLLGGSPAWRLVLYGVIGAALLALLVWLALLLRSVRGHRPARARGTEARAALPSGTGMDAAAWRAELDRRLEAGDLAAALESAWWWVASSLAGARVDPAWTSRELLTAAGRPDLAPAVRGLDALIYGARRPERAAVERVVGRLAEELAQELRA